MIMVFLILVSLLACLLLFLLYRAAIRLLQFDTLLQAVMEIIDSYSIDLAKMSSGEIDGILAEHPEIRMFHLRNVRAKADIQKALSDIARETPRRRKAPALPRPDME